MLKIDSAFITKRYAERIEKDFVRESVKWIKFNENSE